MISLFSILSVHKMKINICFFFFRYDKDFRKTLEKNVPGAEGIIKVVLQEEKIFSKQIDDVSKTFDSVSKSIGSATSTVTSFFSGSTDKDSSKGCLVKL